MAVVKNINDADALLVFRVGPVLCCAPTISVEAVMMPPLLHKPPGSDRNHPGVFRHSNGMVSVVDLRQRFGVEESDWQMPGRMVVTEIEGGHAGFLVDEILDVMQSPQQGWGALPALVPREVFKRTLLLNNQIHLYADFEGLFKFQESGYLRAHIAMLAEKQKQTAMPSGPVVSPVIPDIKVQPSLALPLKQAETETENRRAVATEVKPPQAARTNTASARKPLPASHKKPDSSLRSKPPATTDMRRHDEPIAKSSIQKTAVSTQSLEAPVTDVTHGFEQNEKWPVQQRKETDNASGKFIIAGVIVALLLAMTLVLMSDNKSKTTIINQSAQETTKAESIPAVVEPEPVQNYQASVTQDAEGIVITIDAVPEDLIEQQPSSEVTTEKRPDITQTKAPASVAEEKVIVHVVVKGDTLWEIANRYVRDPWRYPELAKLSNIKNPHRIYPGNKVKIIMRTAGKTEPK